MLVRLIGKNQMNKIILPQTAIGNYWITDKNSGKHLINIEGQDGNWQIVSNKNVKVVARELETNG